MIFEVHDRTGHTTVVEEDIDLAQAFFEKTLTKDKWARGIREGADNDFLPEWPENVEEYSRIVISPRQVGG